MLHPADACHGGVLQDVLLFRMLALVFHMECQRRFVKTAQNQLEFVRVFGNVANGIDTLYRRHVGRWIYRHGILFDT